VLEEAISWAAAEVPGIVPESLLSAVALLLLSVAAGAVFLLESAEMELDSDSSLAISSPCNKAISLLNSNNWLRTACAAPDVAFPAEKPSS
jgi:cation transporter-like permease